MKDLRTNYAGLNLKNPIIASSCGLTFDVHRIVSLENAGAAAVVLKSIFEEQILIEAERMVHESAYGDSSMELMEQLKGHTLNEYLELIRETKKQCSVPVIASISCYGNRNWVEFAQHIQKAGADALEINILSVQTSPAYKWGSYEQMHIDVLKAVKRELSIPVIMKIGSNLTNPVALIAQLAANDAAGVVLFNRPYQPDIDIDALTYTSGEILSSPTDFANSLRWVTIVSSAIKRLDIAASGGVFTAEAAIKQLLAGAKTLEICSALYQHGPQCIAEFLDGITLWMERKGYDSIDQFRGMMSIQHPETESVFERTQFLRYFGNYH